MSDIVFNFVIVIFFGVVVGCIMVGFIGDRFGICKVYWVFLFILEFFVLLVFFVS